MAVLRTRPEELSKTMRIRNRRECGIINDKCISCDKEMIRFVNFVGLGVCASCYQSLEQRPFKDIFDINKI